MRAKALWDVGLRCYSVILIDMTLFLFGTERSEVQILSPRPFDLAPISRKATQALVTQGKSVVRVGRYLITEKSNGVTRHYEFNCRHRKDSVDAQRDFYLEPLSSAPH